MKNICTHQNNNGRRELCPASLAELTGLCAASVVELRKMGEFHRTDSDGAGFTLLRRGGTVLGIAHTDVHDEVQACRRALQITAGRLEHG